MDVIIGASYKLDGRAIRNWARSAREVGFNGRVVLLHFGTAENKSLETIARSIDVEVEHIQLSRDYVDGRAVCQTRFLAYAQDWLYHRLFTGHEAPRYVISTDVRDVVFQNNPTEWLKAHHPRVLGPSESIAHEDEPWNAGAMRGAFPWAWDKMRDRIVLNAGTFATLGWQRFAALATEVYGLCVNRPLGSDQPAFNLALRRTLAAGELTEVGQSEGWAVQMAVWAKPELAPHMRDVAPVIEGERVQVGNQEPVIVHQYDRFPALAEALDRRYS